MPNWEGKSIFPYLTENRLKTKCGAADNHNDTCHICAKGFLDSKLNQAVISKISNFHESAPNFTYSQKSKFLKHNWRLINHLLLP